MTGRPSDFWAVSAPRPSCRQLQAVESPPVLAVSPLSIFLGNIDIATLEATPFVIAQCQIAAAFSASLESYNIFFTPLRPRE